MKRGHVIGRKVERRARRSTTARLEAMGAAIAAQFAGKSAAEMLAMIYGK
jgi:hypothetical protein